MPRAAPVTRQTLPSRLHFMFWSRWLRFVCRTLFCTRTNVRASDSASDSDRDSDSDSDSDPDHSLSFATPTGLGVILEPIPSVARLRWATLGYAVKRLQRMNLLRRSAVQNLTGSKVELTIREAELGNEVMAVVAVA